MNQRNIDFKLITCALPVAIDGLTAAIDRMGTIVIDGQLE